jgi:hypothetical protein
LSGFVDGYQPVWQGSFGVNDNIVTDSISLSSGNVWRFYVVAFNVISDKYAMESIVEKSTTVDWWAAVGPSAPVVSATASDLTSITVSWTAPVDNGGMAISGYIVQYVRLCDVARGTNTDCVPEISQADDSSLATILTTATQVKLPGGVAQDAP